MLGSAKVKNACGAKLAEFRKTSAISSIFIKTFWIFFWWKISQIVFFFLCSLAFGCILFLLGCDIWKMDDLFQRPLGPISIILNFSKKNLVKADIKQLSPKKSLSTFDENWRNSSHIRTLWADSNPPPTPPIFRVNKKCDCATNNVAFRDPPETYQFGFLEKVRPKFNCIYYFLSIANLL